MKITISSRKQLTVTDDLKVIIEKKLKKLERIFPGETEAQVKLSIEHGNKERVEVTIKQGPFLFRSENEDSTFQNALDTCMESIERQIRKNKTRLSKRLHEKIVIPEAGDSIEEEGEFSVRTKHFVLKPMTPEEAILQMNLLGHEFFVFKDVSTEAVCVVYKRLDGAYGVIETE